MHRVLERLRLKTHPDKTFIGRREKGFSFLRYHFCNQELTIAEVSFQNHQARCMSTASGATSAYQALGRLWSQVVRMVYSRGRHGRRVCR